MVLRLKVYVLQAVGSLVDRDAKWTLSKMSKQSTLPLDAGKLKRCPADREGTVVRSAGVLDNAAE